jgi:Ca2+-binding EF-hand superfamily protein
VNLLPALSYILIIQLRRNFSITLSDSELGATIMMFDKDGDGCVDSTEFINEYFKLGQQTRTKHM